MIQEIKQKAKSQCFRYRVFSRSQHRYINATARQDGTLLGRARIAELGSGINGSDQLEIFVGDLIRSPGDDYPFLVVFDDGAFNTIEQDGGVDILEPLSDMALGREVVGNVHFNPSMLEADE